MKQRFTAEIQKHEDIDGAYVEIPFDVEAIFGAKRVKVKASFDGAAYRGSIVRMGGCYMLGLTKQLRKSIGKNPGDMVEVAVEKDEEERVIELPDDFKQVLEQNLDGKIHFEKLSYSRRKEYVQWITDAKKAETRAARIEKAIAMLREGKPLK
ncbi:bifunctional DNA-binding transcriptional regulator/antitoxin component of YhaV-PrlF toxin-antitoxin module [Anaerosolibacter carboniphilus]|uniref:Bifunctional DNA-binding transcriptional regulator/antitoxin component of YhaV-PrlF toxin-antitoxin module n=1 Tax=Anaerosolibacter carboniphilus TaxID=1417629 RepID=A0A841KVB8_9FIRM|nr:YdeI/OmpD-associated family protein [Anaerosolibacter carboniphilus]MBB6216148.1 bifunctional DNA-binding transcriptional regulator/antitoxin component of YhaV-PrlF toxin-antitoxin module [Anaerosolibacter carboniphilus]